jgi:hypothetical protein
MPAQSVAPAYLSGMSETKICVTRLLAGYSEQENRKNNDRSNSTYTSKKGDNSRGSTSSHGKFLLVGSAAESRSALRK